MTAKHYENIKNNFTDGTRWNEKLKKYGNIKFVSRAEAMRIAGQILEQAERERSENIAAEASRGIQWEKGEEMSETRKAINAINEEVNSVVLPELFVPFWKKSQRYDCPHCNTKKILVYPDYRCNVCGLKYKLKVKLR